MFVTSDNRTIGHLYARKSLGLNLTHYIKIKSKYDIDLNIKYTTIKLLEENKGKSLWPCVRQGVFSYNFKSIIHKKKKW